MNINPKVAMDLITVLYIITIRAITRSKIVSREYNRELFLQVIILCIVLVTDALTVLLQGVVYPHSANILAQIYSLNYFSESLFFFVIVVFGIKWCRNKKDFSIFWSIFIPFPVVYEAIVLIINQNTGLVFYIDEQIIFQRGPLHFLYPIPITVYLIETIIWSLIGIFTAPRHTHQIENSSVLLISMFFPAATMISGIFPSSFPWIWSLISGSLALVHFQVYNNLVSQNITNEALASLGAGYVKILKINLKDDTTHALRILNSERGFYEKTDRLSQMFNNFIEAEMVHPDDREIFRQKLDIPSLKEYFDVKNEKIFRLTYRRKTNDAYRWSLMEITRAIDYSETTPNYMLLVSDIHDDYEKDQAEMRRLKNLMYYDLVSGLRSRYSYYETMDRLIRNNASSGIVFADLNGLKNINEEKGHVEGDAFIKTMGDRLSEYFERDFCYRISGDEFVILYETDSEEEFRSKTTRFKEYLASQKIPPASCGFLWCECAETLEKCITAAEILMYEEKRHFHLDHPEYNRRR